MIWFRLLTLLLFFTIQLPGAAPTLHFLKARATDQMVTSVSYQPFVPLPGILPFPIEESVSQKIDSRRVVFTSAPHKLHLDHFKKLSSLTDIFRRGLLGFAGEPNLFLLYHHFLYYDSGFWPIHSFLFFI